MLIFQKKKNKKRRINPKKHMVGMLLFKGFGQMIVKNSLKLKGFGFLNTASVQNKRKLHTTYNWSLWFVVVQTWLSAIYVSI